MAEATLEVIIKGTDKTQGAFGSFKSNLQSIGKVALGVGVAGLAAVGTAAIGVGAKLITLGSDAEEMMGKFNVVFANTGDMVTSQLDEFAASVGRSRFELMGMASTFGDTLKPMGFTEQAAASMSVQLSKLAVDLGSFNNMETDEALRRLQGTLIGSHENALAFGVIINENTLSAKLAEMGLDDLTGAALEQAKVQARLALLMEGTTDAQGDALRTSASWANQMRALKSRITDVATELGQKLLTAVTPLLSMFGDLAEQAVPLLTAAFDRLMPIISDISAFIRGFISALQGGQDPVNAMIDSFLTWTNVGENLSASAFNLVIQIGDFWEKLKEGAEPILAATDEFVSLQDVLVALGIAIAAVLIPAIISVVTTMAPIILTIGLVIGAVALLRNAWENNWGGIQEKTQAAVAVLQQVWQTVLLPAIQSVWQWLQDVLMPFITGVLVPWLQVNIPAAIEVLRSFWVDTLLPAIQKVWSFIQDDLIPLFTELSSFIETVFSVVLRAMAGIWQNVIMPALETAWGWIKDNILPILRELWDWISSKINPILEAVGGKFQAVNSAIGGLSGAIQSVIGWLRELKAQLDNIELPDWMTPGSPTPWEIGLRGVSDAMRQLNNMTVPGLDRGLNRLPTPALAGAGGGFGGAGNGQPVRVTLINPQFYGVSDTNSLLSELENLAT